MLCEACGGICQTLHWIDRAPGLLVCSGCLPRYVYPPVGTVVIAHAGDAEPRQIPLKLETKG